MRFKIDADSHYLDPNVFEFVKDEFKDKMPKFTFDENGKLLEVWFKDDPSKYSRNPLPSHAHNRFLGFCNLEERIKELDSLGVNFQILNPQEHAIRFSNLVDPNIAIEMAYSFNRNLLKNIRKYPDKFAGSIMLVMQDVDWSLNEMRWAKENGFNSVIMDVSWNDHRYLPGWPLAVMPRLEEIIAECVKLDMLLNLHHSMHQIDYNHIKELRSLKLHNLFPSHHKTAVISLITSNIIDKYPEIQILMSEGMMKYIAAAYDYLLRNHDADILKYFKNNFYFTIEPEQTQEFEECIRLFGAERFLFATDYPHDDPGGEMKFHDHKIIENCPFLNDEQKDLICYKNAIKIFKLTNLKV